MNLQLRHEHGDERPVSLEAERARLAEQERAAHTSGIGFLTITRKAEGDAIGYCGLLIGHCSIDEPEIAYEQLQHHHGHGYATEAARAVLDAAFATGRRRIWATVWAWNTPSLRVLEKLGFRRDHSVPGEQGENVYLACDA